MTSNNVGQWIDVTSDQGSDHLIGASGRIRMTPSPYDVPLAIRLVEGDAEDAPFAIEMRYLGGNEPTKVVHADMDLPSQSNSAADFVIEVGTKTGRMYRVIEVKRAGQRNGAPITDAANAIGRYVIFSKDHKSSPDAPQAVANYELVKSAVEANQPNLVAQWEELVRS